MSSKEVLDFAAIAIANEQLLKHEVCYNAEKACTCQGTHWAAYPPKKVTWEKAWNLFIPIGLWCFGLVSHLVRQLDCPEVACSVLNSLWLLSFLQIDMDTYSILKTTWHILHKDSNNLSHTILQYSKLIPYKNRQVLHVTADLNVKFHL